MMFEDTNPEELFPFFAARRCEAGYQFERVGVGWGKVSPRRTVHRGRYEPKNRVPCRRRCPEIRRAECRCQRIR